MGLHHFLRLSTLLTVAILGGIAQKDKDKQFQTSAKQKSISDIDVALRFLDRARMNVASQQLKEKNIRIKGFYHTSTWQAHWANVITEQIRIMDGTRFKGNQNLEKMTTRVWSSVLSISHEMHLSVAGSSSDYDKVKAHIKSLNLKHEDRIKMFNYPTMERSKYRYASADEKKKLRAQAEKEGLSEGEYGTINALHAYCRNEVAEGRKSFVYYVHNKGGCCDKGQVSPVVDWREEMNSFNLEFPSTCLRALLEGYKTCGVEYQIAHYSGNYWWADCDHIAALPGLWDPIDNAYACEYFVFNVSNHEGLRIDYGENCGYNMFHCRVNHYESLCPREKYIPKILEYVSADTLPPSITLNKNRNNEWVSQKCAKAHQSPYIDQSTYRNGKRTWWE